MTVTCGHCSLSLSGLTLHYYVVTLSSMARHTSSLSDQIVKLVTRRFGMLSEAIGLRMLQILEQGERTVGEIVTTFLST